MKATTSAVSPAASSVAVAVPIYTLRLRESERAALRNTLTVLSGRSVVLVAPEGLDLSALPRLLGVDTVWAVERFAPHFFNGREGYNRLMTDAAFYGRFASSGYHWMLVCQTDVWLFADDLSRWCAAAYDYVGAPWLPARAEVEGFYPLHRLVYALRRRSGSGTAARKWQVGNGGLSLRRVAVMADVARRHADDIARICRTERGAAGFEDVFWGVEANRLEAGAVRVAPWREALAFSVESHPDYALRLLDGNLPMGTHAYARTRNARHWRAIIPREAFDTRFIQRQE